jgi:hypothetical protein
VLKAIAGKTFKDPFKCAEMLNEESALEIPSQIVTLKDKERRFIEVIEKTQTAQKVLEFAIK